jgi:hypothetical protein
VALHRATASIRLSCAHGRRPEVRHLGAYQ